MKTRTFEFDLKAGVRIKPLKREGKIISICITEQGEKYEVRYFDNAEAKTVYFYADELERL